MLSKGNHQSLIAPSESVCFISPEQIIPQEQLVEALALWLVDCVKENVIRHIEIKTHHHKFVIFAKFCRRALAHAVVGKDLDEGIVFGGALETEPVGKELARVQ